jgi:hypothetical protein
MKRRKKEGSKQASKQGGGKIWKEEVEVEKDGWIIAS